MKTVFMLMAQYDGCAVIPVETVCRDYFQQFTPSKFIEKIRAGELKLPLVRLGPGQKCAKGIPLHDLAAYLDEQISAARKDMETLSGA